MEHFQEHRMQEQSDGKHVIIVNSEALQLARVSKIIRSEIFHIEKAFEFANKFSPNCQIVCPTA